MTAKALQRVVVRMLYDPVLVEAVYAGDGDALADVPLTAAERGWLKAPDRRRWSADPLRRIRGLHALLEEYPVAGAFAARHHGVPALDRFFSAPAFHDCVQHRGSLAGAFGCWLADQGPPSVAAFATLERGIAQVRRAPPPAPAVEGHLWRTAPWAFAAIVPGGTLAGWQALDPRLKAHAAGPVVALLDPGLLERLLTDGPIPALDPDQPQGLVVERTGPGEAQVVVGQCPIPLAALLERLERPHDWPATAAALQALGAAPDEVEAVAGSLVDDALLTRSRPF